MSFPSVINIELTNICNKGCHMCGRRKREKNGEIKYFSNMSFDLLEKIAGELKDKQVLIQFHWDGEPTMYPQLKEALELFKGNIRCFNTNGKLLVKRADDIIDNMETLTLSTFEGDSDREEQWDVLQEFLAIKGDRKPNVVIRRLGDIPEEWKKKYEDTGLLMADRILHAPGGSFSYTKKVTVPEHGVCIEALMHPAINVNGDMSQCVRFDPDGINILGNLNDNTIEEIWNREKRKEWLQYHIEGNRDKIPMCSICEFWGVPKGD